MALSKTWAIFFVAALASSRAAVLVNHYPNPVYSYVNGHLPSSNLVSLSNLNGHYLGHGVTGHVGGMLGSRMLHSGLITEPLATTSHIGGLHSSLGADHLVGNLGSSAIGISRPIASETVRVTRTNH